jgi:pilus assembly protein CpaC
MQNMTNYPGCPRSGRMVLRALMGAGVVGGMVVVLAPAGSSAPVAATPAVSITGRTPARAPVVLTAARQTARIASPKPMGEAQPANSILKTARRRLAEVAAREAAAGGLKTMPLMPVRSVAGAARPLRLAQAGTTDAPEGDLKTAAPAIDSRFRNFGSLLPTGRAGAHPMGGCTLKTGESKVLKFRWVSRIAIGNPAVADVVAVGDNEVLVNAKANGETNLFVWDKGGQHEFKVAVFQGEQQDLNAIARQVSHDLNRDDVMVRAFGDSVFLMGQVKTAAEQQQAQAVAEAYTKNVRNFIQLVQDAPATPERTSAQGVADAINQVFQNGSVRARALSDGNTVVLEGSVIGDQAEQARHVAQAMAKGVTIVDNFGVNPASRRQVLVRSRVIDIDRVKSRELGIDWGPVQIGAGGARMVGEQPFQFGEAQLGPIRLDEGGPLRRLDPIGFKLRALERNNAAHVLSEPNLLVMEGEKGGIHIGGEIPIPVAQQAGTGVGTSITVEYKPFGIRLDVQAISITDEDVTLRISPEVSALDFTNAVTVNGFNLPALRTRRADSVVRIKRGQTLAIGGLLQNDMNKQVKAIPLLSKIPILGQFFKDTRFQRGESELVILVTPEVPGADNTVSTPIPNVELKRPDPNIKSGR